MKANETKKNKGLWKNNVELKKKKRQLKRTTEERGSTGRRGPRRRELTNYRRTFK